MRRGSLVLESVIAAASHGLGFLASSTLALVPLVHRGPGRPPLDKSDPQAVLATERRRLIYEAIEQRPGISVVEIRNLLDLGGGTLVGHLDVLLEAGLVETRQTGPFVRFYTAGQAPAQDDPSLLPETTKEIARHVLHDPGITSRELGEIVRMGRIGVNKHLRVLVARGLVRQVAGGRSSRYEPTPKLQEVVASWKR